MGSAVVRTAIRGSARFKRARNRPIISPMNATRPTTASKPQALGAVLALRDRHDRQRELVRASLLARPTVRSTTHRRAA